MVSLLFGVEARSTYIRPLDPTSVWDLGCVWYTGQNRIRITTEQNKDHCSMFDRTFMWNRQKHGETKLNINNNIEKV